LCTVRLIVNVPVHDYSTAFLFYHNCARIEIEILDVFIFVWIYFSFQDKLTTKGEPKKSNTQERKILMSPKELNYVDDALGHEAYMKTKCSDIASSVQDPELRKMVEGMTQKHEQLFNNFMKLV